MKLIVMPIPKDTLIWRSKDEPPPEHGWVCFHCGMCIKSAAHAEDHFGKFGDEKVPLCFDWGDDWLSAIEHTKLAQADLEAGRLIAAKERMNKAEHALKNMGRWAMPYDMREHRNAQEQPP